MFFELSSGSSEGDGGKEVAMPAGDAERSSAEDEEVFVEADTVGRWMLGWERWPWPSIGVSNKKKEGEKDVIVNKGKCRGRRRRRR